VAQGYSTKYSSTSPQTLNTYKVITNLLPTHKKFIYNYFKHIEILQKIFPYTEYEIKNFSCH